MPYVRTPLKFIRLSQSSLGHTRKLAGIAFVLPGVLFTLVFFIFPLFLTGWISLHDWPLLGQHRFIGLDNYSRLLNDQQFWASLWFTTKYTLAITPIIFILAFLLALIVKQPLKFVGVFRTAYFMPFVIGLGTSSLLWVWLLNDRVGIINRVLMDLHIIPQPVVWLGDINLLLPAVIISVVWKTVGFTMVLLLTGMQAIPDDLYEAAHVDGAGYWDQLFRITIPLLRSTFALALILSVIGSYLAFDQFYIMTRGGPQNQTITVVYWIFANSFTYFKMGYGAALSIVLLLILVVLSVFQLYLLRDDTNN